MAEWGTLKLSGLWARGQAGPWGLKCFHWPVCEEEQFPCRLGAFIFISKRRQNAELGICKYVYVVSWSGVVLLLLSGHLPYSWNVDISSRHFTSMSWIGKAAFFCSFHYSDSTHRSSWGAVILPTSLGRKKQLTCIFNCCLLNHRKIISKAEGWCLVWNRCVDGDICEFFIFCSKQED